MTPCSCCKGPTGIGKSTLFEILAGEGNYAALTEEKDMLQNIHGPVDPLSCPSSARSGP
jgi:predicted ATPase